MVSKTQSFLHHTPTSLHLVMDTNINQHTWQRFTWILQIKLMSSHFPGQGFTAWTLPYNIWIEHQIKWCTLSISAAKKPFSWPWLAELFCPWTPGFPVHILIYSPNFFGLQAIILELSWAATIQEFLFPDVFMEYFYFHNHMFNLLPNLITIAYLSVSHISISVMFSIIYLLSSTWLPVYYVYISYHLPISLSL